MAEIHEVAAPEQGAASAYEGIHGRQLYVIMGGIMLGLLLSALDSTVVGPAMFNIIRDLRGLEHYAWVTTAYLLTSTITVPMAGKLGDLYGRKWFFVGGMVIFLIGSALSGLSRGVEELQVFGIAVPGLTVGMAELILYRAVQGIGGGFMTANAFAIIGDLVAPADRGRWQGVFGAVFGVASVIGPSLGGFITDNIGWQWVFYVNVPVGLIAIPMVSLTFPHLVQARTRRRSIDWLGALTLIGATAPLLLALSLGGSRDFPWGSTPVNSLFVGGAIFLALFLWAETRAVEPIIPLDLFKSRIFTLAVITVTLVGLGMFGAIINLPLFIQGVQGGSATTSGNSVLPLMFGSIIFSIISGQIVSRTGRYRIMAVIGQVIFTFGMFLLSTMTIGTPPLQTAAYMVVMGIGLGVAQPLYTLIVQNAFPPERLGVVTAATTFFRSMGGTVGVAIFGLLVNNRFNSAYQAALPAQLKDNPQFSALLSQLSPQALVSPDTIAAVRQQLQSLSLPAAQIDQVITAITAPVRPALGAATTGAFFVGALILALSTLTAAFIPEIALRRGRVRKAANVEDMAIAGAPEALSPELSGVSGDRR